MFEDGVEFQGLMFREIGIDAERGTYDLHIRHRLQSLGCIWKDVLVMARLALQVLNLGIY